MSDDSCVEMLDMFGNNLWSRKKLLGLLLLFQISVGLTLSAESKKPQPAHPDQVEPVSTKASHDIRVTINSSTAKIIEGAVYGVNAELENISNVPVSVDIALIQLAVQPELAPSNVSCTWFYEAGTNTAIKSPAVLLPGDHITVFFDTGQKSDVGELRRLPSCEATRWGILRKQIDFVPGNFAFVVSGTYTTQASVSSNNTSSQAKSEQHYFTETANLPVTIDQSQTILYAAIGGFLAFLVMSLRNADTLWDYAGKATSSESGHWRRFMVIVRGAGAAILLSSTVTVVAGRLSTTTFPVRVSVDDFWGALTIGFVSFFIGGKFIDKLSETLGPKPQPEGSVPPAAKAAPPAVPAPAGPNASPPAAPA